jgi:hypothetical protein
MESGAIAGGAGRMLLSERSRPYANEDQALKRAPAYLRRRRLLAPGCYTHPSKGALGEVIPYMNGRIRSRCVRDK